MDGAKRTWRIASHNRDRDLGYELIIEEHRLTDITRLSSNAVVHLKNGNPIGAYECLKSIESAIDMALRGNDRIALPNEFKALEMMEDDS